MSNRFEDGSESFKHVGVDSTSWILGEDGRIYVAVRESRLYPQLPHTLRGSSEFATWIGGAITSLATVERPEDIAIMERGLFYGMYFDREFRTTRRRSDERTPDATSPGGFGDEISIKLDALQQQLTGEPVGAEQLL